MAYDKSKWGLARGASFSPTAAFPLDQRSYFETLSEAIAAAKSAKEAGDSTTTHYYGEIVTVVVDGIPTIYKIEKEIIQEEGKADVVQGKLVSLEQAGAIGESVLAQAKAYTNESIQALDVTDTAETGKFVTSVSETDGKITVTRAALQSSDLPEVPLEKLVNTGTMKEIPAAFLPSFVDDVIEIKVTDTAPSSPTVGQYYYSETAKKLYVCEVAGSWKETTPESGKVYVDTNTNITYRWSGTQMVKIASDLALGETESTAYRGDRGKTAYDHATDTNKISEAKESGFYKVAVTAEGHIASVTAVTASDIPVGAYQFADGTNKFTVTKPDGTTQDVTVTPSIDNATQSSDGLMSKEDKTKIDGVTAGANKVESSATNGNIKIDGTETTVYTHATTTATDAAAVKIGKDSEGHVVIGEALTGADVGVSATTTSVTVDGTTFKQYEHPTYTAADAAAKKVGLDSTGHVVLGTELTKADVGLDKVANQTITVTSASVSDGTNTFEKYEHPTTTATDAAAVKIGKDDKGHVVIGDALTKADVGLDKVVNQTITVTSASVSDGTNTFSKYTHASYAQADAAAKKIGRDSEGHVIIGDTLTGSDIGASATTHSVTIDGTTFSHEYNETPIAAAAVKVGSNAKGHVVLGDALTAADVGVSATTTSVTVGSTTFNQYVHPTTTATDAAAVKVGKDSEGHVVLGAALAVGDISGLNDELGKKQDNLGFTGTYSKTDNPVALKDYVDAVDTELTTLKDVQISGSTNVVSSVTIDTNGKLSVTKGSVSESDLDNALSTKINNATSALHFIGVKSSLPDATKQKVGDVVLVGKKEYVVYLDETVEPSVNKWAEMGDESIYLTKTDASTTYETIANCNTIRGRLDALESDTHTHANKATLDNITSDVKSGYDTAVTRLKGIANGATKVTDGTANGTINITTRTNDVETTEVVTVYDDTTVKSDIAANTASITALSAGKANKVTVNTSSTTATLQKVEVNSEGIVSGTKAVTKNDLDGVIGTASTSQNGLMTTEQVTKLEGVATGAQVNVVEGAKDANGTAFTIVNKMIVIDQIILDGGSATSQIS